MWRKIIMNDLKNEAEKYNNKRKECDKELRNCILIFLSFCIFCFLINFLI